jgi:hypothetical protein
MQVFFTDFAGSLLLTILHIKLTITTNKANRNICMPIIKNQSVVELIED